MRPLTSMSRVFSRAADRSRERKEDALSIEPRKSENSSRRFRGNVTLLRRQPQLVGFQWVTPGRSRYQLALFGTPPGDTQANG
jgi:hypothetical protein